ncbi:MAG: hypothetical protein WCP55_10465, partial [Lentisphaerota bacterium]
MKNLMIPCIFSFLLVSVVQADKSEPPKETKQVADDSDFVKPVFQLKNWDKDVKKPEVADDSSNITKEKR